MREHFRKMDGYLAESYPEGDEALIHLAEKNPYLIILNHNLSHQWKDGLFYLGGIKKLKPNVPIFYIAGDISKSLQSQAIKAGANKFIFKDPNSLMHLRKAIDELAIPEKKGFFSKFFNSTLLSLIH